MNFYIFDTEAAASTAQVEDYNDYIASLPTEKIDSEGVTILLDNTNYIEGTTSWSNIIKQRQTDNKWVYPICPASTAEGRTIEERNTGGQWFPSSET